MRMNRRVLGGVMAVAMGVVVGCTSTPPASTQLRSNEAVAPTATVQESPLGFTEDTLTPAEEGVGQEAAGYSVQQYRNSIFAGNRCRWFWVPSRWGWPYANNWNSGRWVQVCSRREIPWWWYAGPYGSFNERPRFRPHFPDRFRQFDRDHDRRGGRDRERGGDRDRGGRDRDHGGDRDRGGDRDHRGPGGGGGGGMGPGGGMGGRR